MCWLPSACHHPQTHSAPYSIQGVPWGRRLCPSQIPLVGLCLGSVSGRGQQAWVLLGGEKEGQGIYSSSSLPTGPCHLTASSQQLQLLPDSRHRSFALPYWGSNGSPKESLVGSLSPVHTLAHDSFLKHFFNLDGPTSSRTLPIQGLRKGTKLHKTFSC